MRRRRMIGWVLDVPRLGRELLVRSLVVLVGGLSVLVVPVTYHKLRAEVPVVASSPGPSSPIPIGQPVAFPEPVRQALYGKVIVVDVGHGGGDPGAIGVSGVKEKDVNLGVALKLKAILAGLKAAPLLTREDDDPPALAGDSRREGLLRRVEMLQGRKVAAFVSVHSNKLGKNTPWKGAQVFYEPGGHPDGKLLAAELQRALGEVTGTDRVPQQVKQLVLKQVGVPASTVEVGFLSNAAEEAKLQDPAYQQKLAEAIALGLGRYFAAQVGKSGS